MVSGSTLKRRLLFKPEILGRNILYVSFFRFMAAGSADAIYSIIAAAGERGNFDTVRIDKFTRSG